MISPEDIKSNYKIWLQIKSKSVSYSKESLYNRFFRQYKREQITKDDFLLLKNALKDIPQKYSEKIEFRKYINFMEKNFSYTYAGEKLYKNKSINAYKSELTTESYTNYMLGIALKGDSKDIAMTIMPCTWSYYYIGKHLYETYKENLKDNYLSKNQSSSS